MANAESQLKTVRIIVLSAGTLLTVLFLLVFGPKVLSVFTGTAPELPPDQQWEGDVMVAMFAVFMIGYVVGWFRPLWGGTIMILAACLVSLPFMVIRSQYSTLIFGIPQLAVGLLYLLLYRVEKKNA
jgi:hypothetical protein